MKTEKFFLCNVWTSSETDHEYSSELLKSYWGCPAPSNIPGLEKKNKKEFACPWDKLPKDLLVWAVILYLSSNFTKIMTSLWINRNEFMALVPWTSSWKIYLSLQIFTCPRQEDILFFSNRVSPRCPKPSWTPSHLPFQQCGFHLLHVLIPKRHLTWALVSDVLKLGPFVEFHPPRLQLTLPIGSLI